MAKFPVFFAVLWLEQRDSDVRPPTCQAHGLLLTKTPISYEQRIIKRFSYDLVFSSGNLSVAFLLTRAG
jgi:hypothetical protein